VIDEGEEGKYADNEILESEMVRDDSVGGFKEHKDSVFCVSSFRHEPFDTFVSGDGNDKAIVWKL
jgi:hypothetical protein